VSWGLRAVKGEIDLMVVRPSGWATEIEIKVSVSDVKADLLKGHGHDSACVQTTFFAVPKCIIGAAIPHIPERFGVLVYDHDDRLKTTSMLRGCRKNKAARKLRPDEIMKLGRLASMRIWSLKEHMIRSLNEKRYYEKQQAEKAGEWQI
jgi:hypothetical protein